MTTSFERLWTDKRAVTLDHRWLSNYRSNHHPRAPRADAVEVPTIGVELEPVRQPVQPRGDAGRGARSPRGDPAAGHSAGLVVMATGLGKTWLAAFDSTRPEFRRVLFVAHREEILRQSREAFRQIRPMGSSAVHRRRTSSRTPMCVFASVQSLANRLLEFDPDEFDYIVIDEFHHAAARTYRHVIAHFDPSSSSA